MPVSQVHEEFADAHLALERLHQAVMAQLGSLIAAHEPHNPEQLQAIIIKDQEIDRMELQVHDLCVRLIEQKTPRSSGLRFLLGTIDIARSLERVGDTIEYIARSILALPRLSEDFFEGHGLITAMLSQVERILTLSHTAWSASRLDLIGEVSLLDTPIDDLRARAFRMAVSAIRWDRVDAELGMKVVLITNKLEAIGDIAVAIAETTHYIISSEILRHRRLADALPATRTPVVGGQLVQTPA